MIETDIVMDIKCSTISYKVTQVKVKHRLYTQSLDGMASDFSKGLSLLQPPSPHKS